MTHHFPLSDAIRDAKAKGRAPVIADIKPISPRDGELLGNRSPARWAQLLSEAGACALSVVTETKHFGGSREILEEVVRATSLPVLRKDFFSEPEQIAESHEAGAGAVLLIMATTSDALASLLYQSARDLGMEVVVEIHCREELHRALKLNPTIIGINNRDILDLERDSGDVRVTEELAPLVPDPILTISESALHSREEVRRALQAGADGVLIGTAILQSSDPHTTLMHLLTHP
jgi:indole-3-glycerol phosphate synthase